jgi:hypothetical protein
LKGLDLYTISAGLYIAVHNNSRVPLLKYEGFPISVGSASTIGISRTFYDRMGPPYSGCRENVKDILPKDSQYYKETLKVNEYSQQLCFELCFQGEMVTKNCSCWDPSIPYVEREYTKNTNNTNNKISICMRLQDLECVKRNRYYLDENPISNLCAKHCPQECNSINYKASVTTSNYPTKYYSDILQTSKKIMQKYNEETDFLLYDDDTVS